LETMGYTDVTVASTEAEAVARARARLANFDLLTVDARLARGCGIGAALEICAERPIPVVFATSNASRVIERVRDPVLIEKPFTYDELSIAVMRARAAPGLRPVGAFP
jgi:DNA-binding NtrC family response regulator